MIKLFFLFYICIMARNQFKYKPALSKLCTPSYLYFLISIILLCILGVQNIMNKDDTFCIGMYECSTFNKITVFLLHGLYILFWTFILDLMCKSGYKQVSWFIFLLPLNLFFIFFGLMIYNDISLKRI